MKGFKTIDEVKDYFSKDRFATMNGISLDNVDEHRAVCSMIVEERHKNAFGGVMGGAIFTLADFAFATLTNDREHITVAQQSNINFLSPAKGDKLTAQATYRKNGRSSCVVTVDVTDSTGRDIALVTTTGYHLTGSRP
jgi:acyl-CoA thioesterase